MDVAIDFAADDAQAKAEAMTALFKQAAQQKSTESNEPSPTFSIDLERSGDSGTGSDTARTHAQAYCLPSSVPRTLPSMQMKPGLFSKQGPQAVCCTFHAQAQAGPTPASEFAQWTLASVTPMSAHSAVYRFTSADEPKVRGTPYTRGRGRTIWHKTWHTTLRIEGTETDYAPISTWEQWDAGEAELLVNVRPQGPKRRARPLEEEAACRLHMQPLGGSVWLSKPKTTLSVPALVPASRALSAKHPDELKHAAVLLVLGGAGGLPTASQVLQHTDASTCFGRAAADRVPPLHTPVHLIYACDGDDVAMTSALARWCAPDGSGSSARLKRLVLAVGAPRGGEAGAPAAFPEEGHVQGWRAGLAELASFSNVQILQGETGGKTGGELALTGELLQAEVAPLRAMGRCRVVVSGSAAFNVAAAKMLEDTCQLDPDAITLVEALTSRRSPDESDSDSDSEPMEVVS